MPWSTFVRTELLGACKTSRMTCLKSEHSKIFPIQKMASTGDKEVNFLISLKYINIFTITYWYIVRDKSRAICELLSDPNKLQEEREFARKTRDKFSGISSTSSEGV